MSDTLPPDLARFLGLPVEPRALPGPAPITQRMMDALKEARETKGGSI